MLVLTFQKKELVDKILNKSYYVDLSKSTFAYNSIRFTRGYNKIIRSLKSKEVDLLDTEGVLWGWVSNPSHEMVKTYLNKGYVAMFIDIDPEKCVMSDYYKFSDYVVGDSSDNNFVLDKVKDIRMCIQCSFTVDSIYSVRAVYDSSFIILYNSIVRSFYAMQILKGINRRVSYSATIRNKLSHYITYKWNKLQYVFYSLVNMYFNELRLSYKQSG